MRSISEIIRSEIITGIPTDRLKAICNAEKDGRCVVLPCKVGTSVYAIISYKCSAVCYKPYACNSFLYGCTYGGNMPDAFYVIERNFEANDLEWLGKTVFLTREAAEEALGRTEE